LQRTRRFSQVASIDWFVRLYACRSKPASTFYSCVCVVPGGSVVGPCGSLGFHVSLWGESGSFVT
jgi:hypothetical protein